MSKQLFFSRSEYDERLEKTKTSLMEQGVDALVATNPANIHYLSGYNAKSEYVPQCLLISQKKEPIWIGRYLDVDSARGTTWLQDENIRSYTDDLLDTAGAHPVDFFVDVLKEERLGDRRIGVEMNGHYLSPLAFEKLKNGLPTATFKDTTLLVNRVRTVKSPKEIEYIRQAAKLTQSGMNAGIGAVREGVKECEVGVAVYEGLTRNGCDPPMASSSITSGRRTTMEHLVFSDKKIERGDVITFEISGTMHRYCCPMARSVVVGEHPKKVNEAVDAICRGLDAAIDTIKPGIRAEEVDRACRGAITKAGFGERFLHRTGYTMGIGFGISGWAENVASFKEGD
jgi:Xaa-Pro dipeptidase